jgi:RNA polymerase sigma factor (sigma-70 family)
VPEDVSIEQAYVRWGCELTRYASALVGPGSASDHVNEAFASVLARGEVEWRKVANPRSYLYRAVFNAAAMDQRASVRRRGREVKWGPLATGELVSDPSVRLAVAQLSVQQRSVIFLSYWLDLSPASVADLMLISEGSVRRHLARARAHLRKVLT